MAGNLACPDDSRGLDTVALTLGNAAAAGNRKLGRYITSEAAGTLEAPNTVPAPPVLRPGGPIDAPAYVPKIVPYVANTLPFPAGISPAIWFDGNQQAYADLAGLVPNSFGFIRRVNEPSPLVGSWSVSSDLDRPYREGNALRFEPVNTQGGYALYRNPGGGIVGNNCTIVISFVARDNTFGGPSQGLFFETTSTVGARIGSNVLAVFYAGGGTWSPAAMLATGVRNTIILRYTAAGVDLLMDAGGVLTTEALATALGATAAGGLWAIGQYGASFLDGSVTQAFAIARAVTDTERESLRVWLNGQNSPIAYPSYSTLIAYAGDSITRGLPGVTYSQTYPFLVLAALRGNFEAENANCAIGGAGVTAWTTSAAFLNPTALYSAARVGNILVIAIGCNDLANGNSPEYILRGIGAPAGSGIYPACDAARAQGWSVVLLTIGPRSDAMGVTQAVYNSRRAAVNADILAHGLEHVAAVVDTTQIAGYGRDGDSNNLVTYQADFIHPTAAGHALVAPAVLSALQSLL